MGVGGGHHGILRGQLDLGFEEGPGLVEDFPRDDAIIDDDEGEGGLAVGEGEGASVEFVVDVLGDDRAHAAVDGGAEGRGDDDGGGAGAEFAGVDCDGNERGEDCEDEVFHGGKGFLVSVLVLVTCLRRVKDCAWGGRKAIRQSGWPETA